MNIESKDLRIGNLAEHSERGVIVITVNDVAERDCSIVGNLSPILSTRYWLKRLGFKHTVGKLWILDDKDNDFYICAIPNGKAVHIGYQKQEHSAEMLVDCEFVHDIQNLWHIHTKEELTILEEQTL